MGTLKTIPVELGLNQPIVSVLMALASHQAQTQTQEDPAVEAVLQPALVLMALSSLQTKTVSWRKFARRSSTQSRILVVLETSQTFVLARMEPHSHQAQALEPYPVDLMDLQHVHAQMELNSLRVDRTSSINFRQGPFLARNDFHKMIHYWTKGIVNFVIAGFY